jgi:hypothetical protein
VPDWNRTNDLQLRRLTLYPTELRAHGRRRDVKIAESLAICESLLRHQLGLESSRSHANMVTYPCFSSQRGASCVQKKIFAKSTIFYFIVAGLCVINEFTFPDLAHYGLAYDLDGGMIPALNRIHALQKARGGGIHGGVGGFVVPGGWASGVGGGVSYPSYGGVAGGWFSSAGAGYGGYGSYGGSVAYSGYPGALGWGSGAMPGYSGYSGYTGFGGGGGMMGGGTGMGGANSVAKGVHRISPEKIYKYLVSISTPAPEKMRWFRWGEAQYEQARIGQAHPFDFSAGNFGGTAAGKGLYVAEDPISSHSYGAGLAMEKKALIAVTAPKGTLTLDVTDPKIQKKLAKVGLSSEDVFNVNPPIMVKYDPYGKWWVLKTMTGVKVKDFTGKNIPTEELFAMASSIYDEPTRQFFNGKIKPHLKNRILKAGYEISAPPEACHPIDTWNELPQLKKLLSNFQDIEKDVSKKEFLWRYDGTCGEYYNGSSLVLLRDGVDVELCKAKEPVAQIRDSAGNCQEVVRNSPAIIVKFLADDQCSPLKCGNEPPSLFGRSSMRNVKLEFADLSFNILNDLKEGAGKIDSSYSDNGTCRKALALAQGTSLLCLPSAVPDKTARLVSLSTFRPAFAGEMKNLNECFAAQAGARSDLSVTCARLGDHFVFLNYEDPFHHFPVEGLKFANLEGCQSKLNNYSDLDLLKQNKAKEELKLKKEVEATLAVQNQPRVVIDHLGRSHPYLDHLFQSSAQVAEGYTVGAHSALVLSQFDSQKKYYPLNDIKKNYHKLNHLEDFFTATLALHDIGKSLGPTEYQHDFTMPILSHFMKKWGYSADYVALAKELVDHDLIGEMLKNNSDPQMVAKALREKAKNLSMDPKDFMQLQTLFYVSDASSYPSLHRIVFSDVNGRLKIKNPRFAELQKLMGVSEI